MGTNFYRIPSVNELETRRNRLMARIRRMELSPSSVNSNFAIEKPEVFENWTPWDEFTDGLKVHLGKRSMGWKFLWNFNNRQYWNDKKTLVEFVRSGRIVDEYGAEMDQDEFIEMAFSWGQEDGYDMVTYYLQHPELRRPWDKKEELYVDGLRVSESTDFS